MTSWQTHLRDGDPVREDAVVNPDDVERMRATVLAGLSAPRRFVSGGVALAVALTALVGVGAWIGDATRPAPAADAIGNGTGSATGRTSDRRQLQFATPGGTRVIWVFDSNFDVR